MSEDKATAPNGGRLDNVLRYDSRLPAILCRTAWSLRDGEWSGPVETRYGLHFVKRVKWVHVRYILRIDSQNADVRRLVRGSAKEDLLFQVRKDHAVTLKY